ncbi:putative endoplasmic reticulum mannosidase mnl2 [Acrodontium crateriforme]|uniref:alpha-1,2-Mannosidase n=1 Tax=Acrodontium crateriforme TaxID=150365 RepID=A0AAQ3M993_9PEZI|nr:putative endoplasmic reticulum mannosidase mnl2 [Acrodontium crateriforme]
MLARLRRARVLLAILVFIVLVVLYGRNVGKGLNEPVTEKVIGGGAVLRKPELKPESEPESKPELIPDSIPELQLAPIPTSKPEPEAETSTAEAQGIQATTKSLSPITNVEPTEAADTTALQSKPPLTSTSATYATTIDLRPPFYTDEAFLGPDHTGKQQNTTSAVHWSKPTEHFPITSTIQLPTDDPTPLPRIQYTGKIEADHDRLKAIKEEAQHAWNGYRDHAFGSDEVKPKSGGAKNPFNGWGATLVDSLDTLYIMGMEQEFEEAVNAVESIDFTTSPRADIPVFEVTIRYLGGLLGAFDVSQRKHRILLDKAVELAEILYGAFDTPNRMPDTYYRWKPAFASQPHRAGSRVVLAELGSLSVEFTRLAQLTGEPKYYDAVARITDAFYEWQNNTRVPGMWPLAVDASGCEKPAQIPSHVTPLHLYSSDAAESPYQPSTAAQPPITEERKYWQDDLSNNVEAGVPGIGKIAGFGNPVTDEDVDKARAHLNAFTASQKSDEVETIVGPGLSKIDGWPAKVQEAEINSASHETEGNLGASKAKRQLDSAPQPQTHSSNNRTGHDVCIPTGLRSPSKGGQELFSLGGQSDSTYEYLPKQYLLLGGLVDQYRTMYLASADAEIEKLLYRPMTPENLDILIAGELQTTVNFTTDEINEKFIAKGEHLTCFTGGMFAMGGKLFNRPGDVEIGRKLTEGCIWAYNSTATGIMPEGFNVMKCENKNDCKWNETAYWDILDPDWEARIERSKPRPKKVFPTSIPPPDSPFAAEDSSVDAPPASSSAVDQTSSTLLPQVATESTDEAVPNDITKRDLDSTFDVSSLPPLPQVLPTPSLELMNTRPDLPPTVPAPNPQTHHSAHAQHPAPPRPALNHADYVAQKISNDGLPPGMTRISSRKYILRPEAIESVFYMYRITGEPYWREAGWKMWEAIIKHTKARYGHAALRDVTHAFADYEDDKERADAQSDSMESFWIAETLKYFYLLFDDGDTWSLDEWVLNTEAHFFKRPYGSVPESKSG